MVRKRLPRESPAAGHNAEELPPRRRDGKKTRPGYSQKVGDDRVLDAEEESGESDEEDDEQQPRSCRSKGSKFCFDDEEQRVGVPLDSVVKVWCVHSTPNFSLPWQRRRQYRSNSSGFCIDAQRRVILTNAHCIEWHTQVKVQRRGSDTKHLAKVVAVGWEADCAVLTVEDDAFWKGIKVVKLSKKVPHLEEHVLCVGFPVGGDTISVTSGVVSRVEVMTYAQSSFDLLGIQIDAAINSGNSGGPAFSATGECLGMAFQSLGSDQAENIGYVIPTVVIMHFLNDLLKNGKDTGFPTLGIDTQTMENPHLREAFGMTPKQKGILVNRIAPTCAAAKLLKVGDVLLAFDKVDIGNDGTIVYRKHGRVAFSWLVAQKFYGEPAELTVLRDGQLLELRLDKLHPEVPLVPRHLFNQKQQVPSYLIVAGLVFTTLSVPFLRSEFGEEWDCEAPIEMIHRLMHTQAEEPGEQLVVLTQVLAHELTVGYEELENMLLMSLNDVKVKNLRQVMEIVDGSSAEFLRFGLHNNLILVLKADAARRATSQALEQHGIPAAMSPDLAPDAAGSAEGCSPAREAEVQ